MTRSKKGNCLFEKILKLDLVDIKAVVIIFK